MSTKKQPTHRKPISLVTQICAGKEQHDNAKLVQSMLPRLALEAFRNNVARGPDWLQVQYWLYFGEALVSLYNTGNPEERIEMGTIVGDAIAALYAIGKRYNESKFTVMTATMEETVVINSGLTIMEAYREITDERTLLLVGKHVERVLNTK